MERGRKEEESKGKIDAAQHEMQLCGGSGALQVPDSCDNSVSLPWHLVAPVPAPVPVPATLALPVHPRLTMNSRAKGRPRRVLL